MRRGRRVLGEEEARLWAGVARSILPLPGRALPDLPPIAPPEPVAPPQAKPAKAAAVDPAKPRRPLGPPKAPPLHPIERPVKRKLARGRLPIDARLDLHDMTEEVAHYALLGFLRRSRAEGLRHVLVITGRGASPGSRGALKRALPYWLETPDFRLIVAGYESAARAHGGEGAFYLRLRRG
ncbi:DNA repair protein [Aureimonas endophytica]|uniref:DNA repair protein n=1 Tax=Aureimonas endophytica TaxID=2027858 RepID=A0A916ZQ03_9HYPH|nr:Smr/MutS family protein [Aureimonas endophytica]GGE07099.1 DNA repair protein [Aureimonas endophytica]